MRRRFLATEMVVRVTSKALECFGAMGLTREAYVERLYRDARMWIVRTGRRSAS